MFQLPVILTPGSGAESATQENTDQYACISRSHNPGQRLGLFWKYYRDIQIVFFFEATFGSFYTVIERKIYYFRIWEAVLVVVLTSRRSMTSAQLWYFRFIVLIATFSRVS